MLIKGGKPSSYAILYFQAFPAFVILESIRGHKLPDVVEA
jgi:hypothetical protein